jgi:hypothetical protein
MDESNDAWNAQASGSSSRPETPSGRNNPHPLASNTILRISHIEGDIRSEDVGSATFPVSRQRQKRVSGADAAKRWNYADDGKAIIDRPHYRSRELLQAYGAAALPIDRRVPEVRPNGVAKSKTPIAATFARNAEVEVGLNLGLPVALYLQLQLHLLLHQTQSGRKSGSSTKVPWGERREKPLHY